MFGIGLSEIILIVIIAIIFIEPEKLPEIARAVAKAFIEFRRAGEELKRNIKEAETEIMEKAGGAEPGAAPKAPEAAAPRESKASQSAPEAQKPAGESAEKKT